MKLSLIEIYTLLAVFHCFLLSLIVLFSRFFRSDENNYLGVSLLIISLVGLNNWFWDNGHHPLLIQLFDLPLLQFLYPVTLLIFFINASRSQVLSSPKKVWLFVPFVLLSIANIIVSSDNVFDIISLPISDKGRRIFYFYKAISFLSIVMYILYTVLSFKFVFLLKSERPNLWLKLNWIFISFLVLFGAFLESSRLVYGPKESLTYLWVLFSIFTFWFIYHGIYRFKLSNERFEIRQLLKNPKVIVLSTHENKPSSHLSSLENLIINEKIHLKPDLSRDEVAEKLGISGGYLSQLLNSKGKKSFSDYINAYRVEESKKMMHNSEFDKYSLFAIGLEAGFNSKSTFYTSFKKETGMTPSHYKNANKSRFVRS